MMGEIDVFLRKILAEVRGQQHGGGRELVYWPKRGSNVFTSWEAIYKLASAPPQQDETRCFMVADTQAVRGDRDRWRLVTGAGA